MIATCDVESGAHIFREFSSLEAHAWLWPDAFVREKTVLYAGRTETDKGTDYTQRIPHCIKLHCITLHL